MIPELIFWCVIFWVGGMAFYWWGNNVAPEKDFDADDYALHAPYRNRLTESALPVVRGEYDEHEQGFVA